MPHSSKGDRKIIIRMEEEDRKLINKMMQHKRIQFENVIKKGVISMLNAHDERRQLDQHHSEKSGFLSRRNLIRKEQVNSVANMAREATRSAPMGTGGAASLVINATSAVGTALLDNVESRREEAEAEERLHSAQMLYYMTSNDYAGIAQQVANRLGYRFQFLLFRLAGGEHGYIKLAKFLVTSMNTYAIKRLREHKGEVVQALIDAAIPPLTDAISYRDWPRVDFSKFKFQYLLGSRRTLESDGAANELIERCGPAVRALLGGYHGKVDPLTGKFKPYNRYTIFGALRHAPFLNAEGEVFLGLETARRKYEALDGTRKYPMILLRAGETSADLGVVTTVRGEFIEDAHVEALSRLVPDFFSHQMVNEEIDTASMCFPNELFECPWTKARDRVWQDRSLYIYKAMRSTIQEDETVIIKDYNKLKAMQVASNSFDVDEVKKNFHQVIREAVQAQIKLDSVDVKPEDSNRLRLNAAVASKYVAMGVCQLMICSVKCNSLTDDDFKLAIDSIEIARQTLFAMRGLPISISNKSTQYAEVAFDLQNRCRDNFQIVSRVVQATNGFVPGTKFISGEIKTELQTKKKIRIQLRKSLQESSRLMDVAVAMADCGQGRENESQFNDIVVVNKKAIAEAVGASGKGGLKQMVAQVRKLRHVKDDLERAIMDNIEQINAAVTNAKLAVSDIEEAMREMNDMDEKLSILQDSCFSGNDITSRSSPSDNKFDGFLTVENVPEQLDMLIKTFASMSELNIIPFENVTSYVEMIRAALIQVIVNCADVSNRIGIPKEEIKAEILNNIALLKEEIAQGTTGLVDNWGLWLVIGVVRWTMQTMQDMEHGVVCQMNRAMDEFRMINQFSIKESPELQIVRKEAVDNIKQAWLNVAYARKKKQEIARNLDDRDTLEFGLVSSTLTWAARLTAAEHKYTRRQTAVNFTTQDVSNKSPVRMVFALMLAYSRDKLAEKKKDIGNLNRLRKLVKQCEKQIYQLYDFLPSPDASVSQKKPPGMDKNLGYIKRLEQVINSRLKQTGIEKDDMESFETNVWSQALRIHFNEWKRKIHNPNTQGERIKALKAAIKESKQNTDLAVAGNRDKSGSSIKKPENEVNVEGEVIPYTITEIEAKVTNFQNQLTAMVSNKSATGKLSSFYNGFFPGSEKGLEPSETSTPPRSAGSNDRSVSGPKTLSQGVRIQVL